MDAEGKQYIYIYIYIYIIVIYVVITVNYCKCILLYSPLNSYSYVQWILDFKSILLLLLSSRRIRQVSPVQ